MKGMLLLLTAVVSSATALAVPITPTVTRSAGNTYGTAALTGYTTTAADMVGSTVTVHFSDGTSGSATWTPAGALGTGWSLVESGDTFSSPFTLTDSSAASITSFTFNGVTGNTTFDTINGPDDTPGSANGQPMTAVDGPAGLTVSALYTNELLVGGVFYGDEYTELIATLGNGGLGTGQSLTFVSDTDNAMASSGITPVAATPEPSSLVLLGTGLLTMAAAAKRRFSPL